VELIKTRLDRIYIQAGLTSSATNGTSEQENSKEKIEPILEDLQSLYSEIYAVAEMSVQNQFLTPILRKIKENDIIKRSIFEERKNYVWHDSLSSLLFIN
jgi:uncharacterized Fe-S cluster-containing MiaB family protein